MKKKLNPIIIIPARMKSTRLPGKPLADINGLPMIIHVVNRAAESKAGPVYVAAAEKKIAAAVSRAGGEAIMTDPAHPSGTDRIYEALRKIDPKNLYDVVINLQGDLPTLEPKLIKEILKPLANPDVDIATLVAEIRNAEDLENPNVVKAALSFSGKSEKIGRALYFSRSRIPSGDGPVYHHIGIYAYRRSAIKKFISLKPSPLEMRERLEQLRALENGMRIDGVVVDTVPLGVDTEKDLLLARAMLN